MKNISMKSVLPHLAAIVIFVLITIVYFSPLLEGKKLKQDDITRHKGMSKEIVDYREKTGKEALWTNSMFSGMPAYQISVEYKSNLTKFFDKIFRLGLPHPANLVFLYLIGFYILMLVLGIDPWISIGGAIAFALSSYFFIILEAGHNSKAHAIGYMAPVLAGIILTYRGKYILGGILSMLFLALEIRAGHPQITYYLGLMVLVLGISEIVKAIQKKTYRNFILATSILVFAAVIGVLSHLSNLWSTYEYGNETIRGKTELSSEKENRTSGLDKDYATDWSVGIKETMTLLIPDFYGGSSSGDLGENSNVYQALIENGTSPEQAREYVKHMPAYWGPQPFTSGPVYVGAIMMLLFVLGLFVVKGNLKWWLLISAVLSVMLAWGKNFMPLTDFFLEYFPGYNKFRAVSMTLVIAELAIPILAILALNTALNPVKDKKFLMKSLRNSIAIVGGILLLVLLFSGSSFSFSNPQDAKYMPEWLVNALMDDRRSMLRADTFRSLIFVVLSSGVLWLTISGKLKKNYAMIAFIVLILIDLWPVNKRYVNNDDFMASSRIDEVFTMTAADERILQDKDPYYRVLNLTVDPFADATTSYYHKSVGGYHGAKLRRYQELFDTQLKAGNFKVINMLNAKYVIQQDNDKQPVAIPNREALGNAWFVSAYKMVNNADEELNSLKTFEPDSVAIIDKRFESQVKGLTLSPDSAAFIRLTSYEPNHLSYESKAASQQLAVFSDIYYDKGWNAYVDGKPVPHFRADFVLRAMVVPPGTHKIEFKFEPRSYFLGEKISLASSLLIVLLVIGGLAYEIRKLFLQKG